MIPDGIPLSVTVRMSQEHHLTKSDLDNNFKSVADCAQGIVIEDDRNIHEIHAYRELGSGYYCELEVERMDE